MILFKDKLFKSHLNLTTSYLQKERDQPFSLTSYLLNSSRKRELRKKIGIQFQVEKQKSNWMISSIQFRIGKCMCQVSLNAMITLIEFSQVSKYKNQDMISMVQQLPSLPYLVCTFSCALISILSHRRSLILPKVNPYYSCSRWLSWSCLL